MTVNDMICKMIAQAGGNKHDIAHFLKVYTYARLIGEKEQLDARTQETLEITAVIHDIACPLCREKYGNASGKHQEQESAPLVEAFLEDTGIDEAMKERISYLVPSPYLCRCGWNGLSNPVGSRLSGQCRRESDVRSSYPTCQRDIF